MFHFIKFLFHIAPLLILAYLWIHFDLGTVIGSWLSHASTTVSSFNHGQSPFTSPMFRH